MFFQPWGSGCGTMFWGGCGDQLTNHKSQISDDHDDDDDGDDDHVPFAAQWDQRSD